MSSDPVLRQKRPAAPQGAMHPADEKDRLASLRACAILDTGPDPRFDAITALAGRLFGVPMALVSLVDQDRQWVKSAFGPVPTGTQTPREAAFCAHTILRPGTPFIVTDARLDPRFADNPLVIGPPHIRFYAGVPLCTSDGHAVGALCVLDTEPRSFRAEDAALLTDQARCASGLIDLYRSLADLRESEAHHHAATELSRMMPWVADGTGRILPVNPRIAAMYAVADWVDTFNWATTVHPDDLARTSLLWAECLATGRPVSNELRMRARDGTYRWFRSRGTPTRGSDGSIHRWYGTLEDITDARARAERADHDATHDPLTGLLNRSRLTELLAVRMEPETGAAPFALFSIDVDNLKGINNTRGPAAGDAVLREAADRLRTCLRQGDLLARSGGDEFLLMFSNVPEREPASELATRILAAFASPALIEGQALAIGVSIGIALWPRDGMEQATLLPNAALALARAKDEGRATFRFFRAETDESLRTRQALQLDLADALNRGQFALAFQPLYNLRNGRLEGLEALLRWHHPQRGSISPAEFIPVAEATGMIVPIGQWVLEQACRAAISWPDEVSVAVNLSPVQFSGACDLLATVTDALAATGLSPRRLELEITESLPLADDDRNLELLRQLRAKGVRIVLDDFGTGYSSLAYLQRFAFDKLKVDRSIVAQAATSDTSRAILRAILVMARALKVRVTAEGVEAAEQAECLRDEGCDEVQGFLFSPPVPEREVDALLSGKITSLAFSPRSRMQYHR